MVHLSDVGPATRKNVESLECPEFNDTPFVSAKPLADRTVAIVSSAGLIRRGDPPLRRGDAGYQEFSNDVADADINISHISVNFDRTAALQNLQAIFPRQLLTEMAATGEIKAAADTHYSFMGATDPLQMESAATELATSLRARQVDTVVLLPV